MSGKLASGLAGTQRADLEALVAQGDTSVPGVEMSDLNDGDILARTRENVNPNGQFQFVYIPETGDPITSDWVGQDFKKQVLRGWVDGVKSALISRGQAGITAANEAEMERKLAALREEQLDDEAVPDIEPVAPAAPAVVAGQKQAVQAQRAPVARVAASNDPSTYVEDQLDIARARLQGAEQAQQEIIREVLNARRDYEKWKALSSALSGIGSDVGVRTAPEPESIIASNSGNRPGRVR